MLKLDKGRADTTVVEANVSYPTDSGLLAKAIARIACLIVAIHRAGGASRTRVRDRRRAAGRRRGRSRPPQAGNDEAKQAVKAITAELADLAEIAAAKRWRGGERRRKDLPDHLDPGGRLGAVTELETLLGRTHPGGGPDLVNGCPAPRPRAPPGWCRFTTPTPVP